MKENELLSFLADVMVEIGVIKEGMDYQTTALNDLSNKVYRKLGDHIKERQALKNG